MPERWPLAVHPSQVSADEEGFGFSVLSISSRLEVNGSLLRLGGSGLVVTGRPAFFPAPNVRWALATDELPNCKFDYVCLYDVLDHMPDAGRAADFLSGVRRYVKSGGYVHVRFHPYSSRCGTHLFEGNRAYWHLYHPDEEGQLHTLPWREPLAEYERLCGGYEVLGRSVNRQECEPRFESLRKDWPELEVQWVDAVLRPKPPIYL